MKTIQKRLRTDIAVQQPKRSNSINLYLRIIHLTRETEPFNQISLTLSI